MAFQLVNFNLIITDIYSKIRKLLRRVSTVEGSVTTLQDSYVSLSEEVANLPTSPTFTTITLSVSFVANAVAAVSTSATIEDADIINVNATQRFSLWEGLQDASTWTKKTKIIYNSSSNPNFLVLVPRLSSSVSADGCLFSKSIVIPSKKYVTITYVNGAWRTESDVMIDQPAYIKTYLPIVGTAAADLGPFSSSLVSSGTLSVSINSYVSLVLNASASSSGSGAAIYFGRNGTLPFGATFSMLTMTAYIGSASLSSNCKWVMGFGDFGSNYFNDAIVNHAFIKYDPSVSSNVLLSRNGTTVDSGSGIPTKVRLELYKNSSTTALVLLYISDQLACVNHGALSMNNSTANIFIQNTSTVARSLNIANLAIEKIS